MGTIYDSGWVPVASGAINSTVDTRNFNVIHVVLAASGSSGSTGASMYAVAGADTLVPQYPIAPAADSFGLLPKVTSSITVANPAANSANHYVVGPGHTGSLLAYTPQVLNINLTAGAASYARIIVEAK